MEHLKKKEALRNLLGLPVGANITQATYDENLFIVNPHKTKYGDSPEEVIDAAEMLRAKLITLFGPEAETWTSDFLRIQEMEAGPLLETLRGLNKQLPKAPEVTLVNCGTYVSKVFEVTEEILAAGSGSKTKFARQVKLYWDNPKYSPVRVPGRPQGVKKLSGLFQVGPMPPSVIQEFRGVLEERERRLSQIKAFTKVIEGLRSYHNLEKVIKDSFDWNRLGNKHDNETAHAYQAIVNPLYLIGASSKWNDGKYQQQLRDAFDRKALTDYRKESETDDGEYLVLTELEAQAAVLENIKESVWAFKAEFLAKWIPLKVPAIKGLQEGCENCNEAILARIGSKLEDFVAAAVAADGRGHFLSGYDGEEVKIGNYFIYRSN